MGAKMPHLRSRIGDLEPIHQSENPSIGGSQSFRSTAHPYLARIFPKDDITTMMQPIFNGIITNDKFCLSQIRHLPKISARKGFPQEIQYPSEATEEISCPKGEIHEKTTVEPATLYQRDS